MMRQLASFVASASSSTSSSCNRQLARTHRLGLFTRPFSSSLSTEAEHSPTVIVETKDGRSFRILDSQKLPKLKPSIVRKRLSKMKTYEGGEKNIRHSPWRLNLICQMIVGLPVPEALRQLTFCDKSRAPLVKRVVKRTSNLADIRDNLQRNQLEVAECFATKGTPLKRIKPMGRGRYGQMTRPFAHMRLVLREIDFKLRIYQAKSLNQKKRWLQLQLEAEEEYARAKEEKVELERYEARQRESKEQENE